MALLTKVRRCFTSLSRRFWIVWIMVSLLFLTGWVWSRYEGNVIAVWWAVSEDRGRIFRVILSSKQGILAGGVSRNNFDLSQKDFQQVWLSMDHIKFYRHRPDIPITGTADLKAVPTWYSRMGFAVEAKRAGWTRYRASVPYWFPFFLSFGLGVLGFRRQLIRSRRLKEGKFCVTCGYDLRATPDRCPECGTVPKLKDVDGKSSSDRDVSTI